HGEVAEPHPITVWQYREVHHGHVPRGPVGRAVAGVVVYAVEEGCLVVFPLVEARDGVAVQVNDIRLWPRQVLDMCGDKAGRAGGTDPSRDRFPTGGRAANTDAPRRRRVDQVRQGMCDVAALPGVGPRPWQRPSRVQQHGPPPRTVAGGPWGP